MKSYSAERKASVIQKMMPPHNIPIPRLVEATGISDSVTEFHILDDLSQAPSVLI